MNKQATAKTTEEEIIIPKGYVLKADGSMVPKSTISEIDLKRDLVINRMVKRAKKVQEPMIEFKKEMMISIEDFIKESAKKYGAKMGGKKGNVTLITVDGRFKVTRKNADILVFDERIQVAKTLVDECIKDYQKGSRAEMKVLVQGAFQVDKQGNISVSKVLALRAYNIKDPKWLEAMRAIADSIRVIGTKPYINLYERIGNDDHYTLISLDVAAL